MAGIEPVEWIEKSLSIGDCISGSATGKENSLHQRISIFDSKDHN